MKFDDVISQYLGDFGPYQKIQFILVCLPTIFTAWHVFSWTFTAAMIPHRCLVVGENDSEMFPFVPPDDYYHLWLFEENVTYNGSLEIKDEKACFRPIGVSVRNWTMPENLNKDNLEVCKDGYKWNHSKTVSAINYWEIVCDKFWIKSFVQSVYYLGQFIGSIVFGIAADKIGRKKVFFTAIIIQITCGSIMAFVPWWPLFAFLRTLVGVSHPGIFLIAVVLGVELVGPSRRVIAGVATAMFFSFGQILLGAMAYYIRNYHELQLTISLPALMFVVYWWIVPESARWLVTHHRFREADEILQTIAHFNKRHLPSNWYEQLDTDETKTKKTNVVKIHGWLDLFRTPNMRKRIIITGFIGWPVAYMAYYGISMNSKFLGGDLYGQFIIAATVEIPALIFAFLTMNILGRKTLCFGGFVAAAFWLLITFAIPADNSDALRAMVILGKMCVTVVYSTFYVYVPELFPTVIRSTAMGLCSMMARVGAFGASYVALWLAEVNKQAAVLIFGVGCLIAAVAVLVLPETSGQPQFDTIEQAEAFGSNQPWFVFSWKAKPISKITIQEKVTTPLSKIPTSPSSKIITLPSSKLPTSPSSKTISKPTHTEEVTEPDFTVDSSSLVR